MSYKARTWLLVVCAVACGAYLAREPFQVYQQQKAKAVQADTAAKQDSRAAAQLEQQQAQLDSQIGREVLARKQGFRKPNETVIKSDKP